MKKAQLPNGQILVFPDNTSDDVIRATIKRITTSKSEVDWSQEHIKTVVRELTAGYGEIDIKRARDDADKAKAEAEKAKAEVEKVKIDNFGPAMEKHSKGLLGAIKDFISEFKSSTAANSKNIVEGFGPSLKELVKELVGLKNQIEKSSITNEKQVGRLIKSIEDHGRLMLNFVKTQEDTQEILKELVKATKASKTVTFDKQGNIKRIDVAD